MALRHDLRGGHARREALRHRAARADHHQRRRADARECAVDRLGIRDDAAHDRVGRDGALHLRILPAPVLPRSQVALRDELLRHRRPARDPADLRERRAAEQPVARDRAHPAPDPRLPRAQARALPRRSRDAEPRAARQHTQDHHLPRRRREPCRHRRLADVLRRRVEQPGLLEHPAGRLLGDCDRDHRRLRRHHAGDADGQGARQPPDDLGLRDHRGPDRDRDLRAGQAARPVDTGLPELPRRGHSLDAIYCRICGSELNPDKKAE